MRSRYRVVITDNSYFITSTIVNWIPLFNNEKYTKFLIEAIKFNQIDKDLKIFAYVIMPDHFHALVQCNNMKSAMISIKGYTAQKFIRELKKDNRTEILAQFRLNKIPHKTKSNYQIWQEGYHPQIIENDLMYCQKIDYIHMNPVKRGLVNSPDKWKYSSYSYYFLNKKSEIDIFSYD